MIRPLHLVSHPVPFQAPLPRRIVQWDFEADMAGLRQAVDFCVGERA
ncbi:hypothetical protein [Magnetospirillum sp. 15-1]|nr:hypothetical protein [Magnetospirillum sp. 15-1]